MRVGHEARNVALDVLGRDARAARARVDHPQVAGPGDTPHAARRAAQPLAGFGEGEQLGTHDSSSGSALALGMSRANGIGPRSAGR